MHSLALDKQQPLQRPVHLPTTRPPLPHAPLVALSSTLPARPKWVSCMAAPACQKGGCKEGIGEGGILGQVLPFEGGAGVGGGGDEHAAQGAESALLWHKKGLPCAVQSCSALLHDEQHGVRHASAAAGGVSSLCSLLPALASCAVVLEAQEEVGGGGGEGGKMSSVAAAHNTMVPGFVMSNRPKSTGGKVAHDISRAVSSGGSWVTRAYHHAPHHHPLCSTPPHTHVSTYVSAPASVDAEAEIHQGSHQGTRHTLPVGGAAHSAREGVGMHDNQARSDALLGDCFLKLRGSRHTRCARCVQNKRSRAYCGARGHLAQLPRSIPPSSLPSAAPPPTATPPHPPLPQPPPPPDCRPDVGTPPSASNATSITVRAHTTQWPKWQLERDYFAEDALEVPEVGAREEHSDGMHPGAAPLAGKSKLHPASRGQPASMYQGVGWSKQKHKWRARVGSRHIGFFLDEHEAAMVSLPPFLPPPLPLADSSSPQRLVCYTISSVL